MGNGIGRWLIRMVAYLGVVVALGYAFDLDVDNRNYLGQAFSEQSLTEVAQVILLAATALLLLFSPRGDGGHRALRRAMVVFFLCLAIRETDHWLDRGWFDGAWQMMVSALLLALAVYLIRERRAFWSNLAEYAGSFSAGLMIGGLLILAFSRVFARKSLWYDIMGERFTGSVKNAVEEGLETVGMVIMLLATVEYTLGRTARRPR